MRTAQTQTSVHIYALIRAFAVLLQWCSQNGIILCTPSKDLKNNKNKKKKKKKKKKNNNKKHTKKTTST